MAIENISNKVIALAAQYDKGKSEARLEAEMRGERFVVGLLEDIFGVAETHDAFIVCRQIGGAHVELRNRLEAGTWLIRQGLDDDGKRTVTLSHRASGDRATFSWGAETVAYRDFAPLFCKSITRVLEWNQDVLMHKSKDN